MKLPRVTKTLADFLVNRRRILNAVGWLLLLFTSTI